MKTMTKMMLAATVAVSCLTAATAANAAIVINITQSGTGVLVNASGAANTTGATVSEVNSGGAFINGSFGVVRVGNGSFTYYNATGPSQFANGGSSAGTATTSGSIIGVFGANQMIALPTGYVSNALISGTATFANQSLTTLGLVQGSYIYRLPNDTVTVNISAGAVPETATWGMMIAGFGMMGGALRTRRRSTKVTFA